MYIYIHIYIYIQFLTFSRSHARTIMLSFFFVDYFFCYHYALVLTLSHHRIRFSLLKAKNIYHYALIFFFISHIFFSQSQPFFQQYFFNYHLSMLSFFFPFSTFFSQSQQHYSTIFFLLCSHYALTHQSFLFSVFSFLSQGGPLQIFYFCNFSNFNINFFKSLLAIHFKRWLTFGF